MMLFRRLNKNVQDFEKKLRDALFFSRYYGVFLANIKLSDKKVISQEFWINFRCDVHTGFKKAQNLIIKELIEIQEKKDVINVNLKSARQRRDKQESKKLEDELRFEDFKEIVYRRIADTIVWQMITGQHYIARALCQPQQGKKQNMSYPKLKESNFNHTLREIDKLNTNPMNFALITDITSFVKLGDILMKTDEGVKIIELKEGEKNLKIKELVKENQTSSIEEFRLDILKKYDRKLAEQAERMFKQSIRMQNAGNIANQGSGLDSSGLFRTVSDECIDQSNNFIKELTDLINRSYLKDWAYEVVECLHIGVYRNRWIFHGRQLIEKIVKDETGTKYPVYDFSSNLNTYLSTPLFIDHPLSIDQVIDLILETTKIYIAIDYDKFFEMFSDYGAECFWLDEKQTQEIPISANLFKFKNRAMGYNYSKSQCFFTLGCLYRILYSNTLPSEIINVSLNDIELSEFKREKTNRISDNLTEELQILEEINLNVSNPYS